MINTQNVKSKKTAISASLGNNAKSLHNKIILDQETGEQATFVFENGSWRYKLSPEESQSQRFALQTASRSLLPYNRVSKCQRLRMKGVSGIGVHKTPQGTGVFKGLQTCGSVWDCPVCSAKVGARRAEECKTALNSWLDEGGRVYFITYTFPHFDYQDCMELRLKQAEAMRILRNSRGYKELKELVQYKGLIRSLEVTYGVKNGFHPHTHELMLVKGSASFGEIKSRLFPLWLHACKKAGLHQPTIAHGIDVSGGDKAAEYINKFALELTLSHVKKAKGERHTPFSMLSAYHYDNDKVLGQKFVEYSKAFHGSRQIYWTNGLKKYFGIGDLSDEELASAQTEKSTEVTEIDHHRWEAVTYYKQRAGVLQVAATQGKLACDNLVEALYDRWIFSEEKMEIDSLKIRDDIRKVKAKENAQKALNERTQRKGLMAHAISINDLEYFERMRKIRKTTAKELQKLTDNLLN